MVAFAVGAGSFAALGGEDVWMAGVGVAPSQVVAQGVGRDGVVRVVRAGDHERA